MNDPAVSALARARELFEGGRLAEAESLLGQEESTGSRDPSVVGFRAYLLYRLARPDEAEKAYRRLTEITPSDPSAFSNLGMLLFKEGRFGEALASFQKVLRLAPGDPKARRNLEHCRRRLGEDRTSPGDLRGRAGEGEAKKVGKGEAAAPAPDWTGLGEWMSETSLPFETAAREILRAGPGEMVWRFDEKIYLNRRFLASHRGVIVFSSASRQANRAAGKFGPRGGTIVRAEGSGEVVLSGRGSPLHLFRAGGEERLHVNYPCLAGCGWETEFAFSFRGLRRGVFLAAEIRRADVVILALRGSPVVLELPGDASTVVRPEAVAAWTEGLEWEREDVPFPGTGLLGRKRETHLRFEGRGYLLLQGLPG